MSPYLSLKNNLYLLSKCYILKYIYSAAALLPCFIVFPDIHLYPFSTCSPNLGFSTCFVWTLPFNAPTWHPNNVLVWVARSLPFTTVPRGMSNNEYKIMILTINAAKAAGNLNFHNMLYQNKSKQKNSNMMLLRFQHFWVGSVADGKSNVSMLHICTIALLGCYVWGNVKRYHGKHG